MFLFRPFSPYNDKYSTIFEYKIVDCVLRIQTWDRRKVGASVTRLGDLLDFGQLF